MVKSDLIGAVQYSIAWYSMVQCSAAKYSTVYCSAIWRMVAYMMADRID